MEENLIGFNSPEQKPAENATRHNLSPGDNPFDLLSKNADLQFMDELKDFEYFLKGDFIGKESLGILKLETLNASCNNEHFLHSPSASLTHQASKDVTNSPLNVAYLQLPSFRLNDKTESISSGSRFNSGSLMPSEPSNICSMTFERSENFLNDAFVSNKRQQRAVSDCTSKPREGVKVAPALSLPSVLNESAVDQANNKFENDFCDSFNDSVFLEAKNVAAKIADGSIVLNKCVQDVFLDHTSPPKLVDLDEEESLNKDNKIYSQPLPQEVIENDGALTVETYEKDAVKKNLSNIFHSVERRQSQSSSGSNGSTRDPNEILFNLSTIINNERRDLRQSKEGEQLLYSLADILCTDNLSINKCNDNLDDSGHSSIEQDSNIHDVHGCFEVLDLRVISKSSDDMQALDLSTKHKLDRGRRLSQSFTLASSPKLFNRLKSQSSSGSLVSNTKLGNASKLKPKKVEEKSQSAKGPLKAVIPVMNMAKRKDVGGKINVSNLTPPKSGISHLSSIFTTKRTSTPIAEPQLKPIAQSTPTGGIPNLDRNKPNSCSSQLKKRKFYCPVSPLTQQKSIDKNSIDLNSTKSSQSASTPNLSAQSRKSSALPSPNFMYRRHSASELKTESNSPLARRYSIGSGSKPNILNKLKKTVSSVTNTAVRKNTTLPKKSTLSESNTDTVPSIKPSTLVGKFRRSISNKENCPRK